MREMPPPWRRHDLLRVKPLAWALIVRPFPDLAALPCVARWAERGWPVIVRRSAPGDTRGLIPAGFPLPPRDGKRRIAVQLAAEDVLEPLAPVTLRAARENAPRSWRKTVGELLALGDEVGIEPRVFGSVLWQHLTGLSYLSASSDLDLLWPVEDDASAVELTRRLAALAAISPVRLDGELVLPDGGAVQWREFCGRPPEVLVKNTGGVELRPVAALFPARALADESLAS